MAFCARKLALVALFSASFSGQAMAVDTREVVIGEQVGLAVSPAHLGHVLASPSRNFGKSQLSGDEDWWVFEKPRRKASWVDTSYLSDRQNAKVLKTYFDFDSDTPIDASVLLDLVGLGKSIPLKYLVIGHADETGSDAYNMQLSVRRANSVKKLMVLSGIPSESIKTEGKGNRVLASLRDQSKNRRVEVLIRGDEKARQAYANAVKARADAERQARMEEQARIQARQREREAAYRAQLQQMQVTMNPPEPGKETKGGQKSRTATQNSLLPPVRESQMKAVGSNPLNQSSKE